MTDRMRLLLAEDDALLAGSLVRGLREQGYSVDLMSDGATAARQAYAIRYDVIVLDVMLPLRNGLEVAKAIRTSGSTVPILMLTARDAVRDRVAGLDAGADDYLTKPFEIDELLARLRALMRRGRPPIPPRITVSDLVVDTRAQVARRGDRLLELTAKEYALLELLARNAGAVVPRADISAHVWDENHDPLSNVLDVCVARLRRKIDAPGEAPLIHTRRGVGYVLAESTSAAADPRRRRGG